MNRQMLKAKIVMLDKTSTEVLEDLGISRSAWYRKLSGASEFTRDEITMISSYLNLDEEEMIGIFFDDLISNKKHKEI